MEKLNYKTAMNKIQNGGYLFCSFERGYIRLDGDMYKLDEVDTQSYLDNLKENGVESTARAIEVFFNVYRSSIPSADDKTRQEYFKALSIDELSDEELVKNERRFIARGYLELTAFFTIAAYQEYGLSEWKEEFINRNQWFWQSENYPDLILLRDWFCSKPITTI